MIGSLLAFLLLTLGANATLPPPARVLLAVELPGAFGDRATGGVWQVDAETDADTDALDGQPPGQGEDLTCSAFADQAEAQAVYEADPGDRHGLDVDLDGIACETPIVEPYESERAADPGDGPAAADDRDCIEFAFQDDAQVVYDREPGDPYNLDPSGDGFACSSLPSRGE